MEGADCVSEGRGRGRGRGRGAGATRAESHPRSENFNHEETKDLLSACHEVQLKYRRQDLKFNPTEMNAVFEAYRRIAPHSERGVDMLKNRLKTMRTEFSNFRSLVNRSGWSWDWTNHKVHAPPGAWEALLAQNYNKWRYYPNKTFPFYKEFTKMVGTSGIRGDFGAPSEVSRNSGSGSSGNPAVDGHDEPVNDSEERDRFDHQQTRYEVDNQSVEGPRQEEPTNVTQPSQDTGRGANGSESSNKRKSTDEPEGSRSRRAKKSITDAQAKDTIAAEALGSIAKSSDRLVEQNDEFLAISHKRLELQQLQYQKQSIDGRVDDVLRSFQLNLQQMFRVQDALNPRRQQAFLEASTEEQKMIISELIPGIFQTYNGGVPFTDGANSSAYWAYGNYSNRQAPN